MPSAAPAVELLDRPSDGRVFSIDTRVRLGDVDAGGRLRLDATARLLQDVATDDASDARLDRGFGWLVRRTLIEVTTPARLGESVEVSTWCTAIGAAWAERRSQVVGERGALIDTVSLWVQIDTASGAPARVGADFTDAYGDSARGRAVSARLRLPGPPAEADDAGRWTIRRTDLDPFDHVNNAATWSFLEHHGCLDETDRIGQAELEYLHPIHLGADPEVRSARVGRQFDTWMLAGGDVVAAARWTPSDLSAT